MRESSSRVNSVVTCVGAVDVMPRLRFFFLRGMEEMDEVEVTMVLFLDTFSVGLGTSTPVVFLVFFFLFLNMIFFNSLCIPVLFALLFLAFFLMKIIS